MTVRQPSKDQEYHLTQAIKTIKQKGFGFIKVELEATFHRRSAHQCNVCTEICVDCDGTGMTYVDGKGVKCSACDYGAVKCPHPSYNFADERVCKDFILATIPDAARKALVYSRFYNDGSVDSEYTFTLPIEKCRYIVPIIQAFVKIGELNGQGIDTAGAGMHTALLNDPRGRYGISGATNRLDQYKLQNMAQAMAKLMPALFFLASADYRSRPMRYRMPMLAASKYSAIAVNNHVLEYRVFETCYLNPYRMYEFIEVIAKTLNFYADQQQLPAHLLRTTTSFRGNATGHLVRRLYEDEASLASLELTLPFLKPDSRTLSSVKRSRGFNLDKQKLEIAKRITINKLVSTWPEYIERLGMARSIGQDVSRYPQDLKAYLQANQKQSPDLTVRF